MKLVKHLGATSEIWQVFIQDTSKFDGSGLTGLTNASITTAYYHRDTDTTATAMSLISMTVGTFTSLGFKEIDASHMPGWYQFCPPNAALASGAKSCAFYLAGATNMAALPIEVQLSAVDPDSATAFMTSVATVTNLTNAPTAGDFTSTMKTSLNAATPAVTVSDKTGFSLSSAGIQAIWDALTSALTTVSSVGKLLVDNLNATISSRLATSSYTVPPTATENADALLKRDMSAVTGEAARSPLNALRWLRNKWTIASGTLTVTKEDDTTTAWTASTTQTAGNPTTGVDPA